MTQDDVKRNGFNGFVSKPIPRSQFDDLVNKYR